MTIDEFISAEPEGQRTNTYQVEAAVLGVVASALYTFMALFKVPVPTLFSDNRFLYVALFVLATTVALAALFFLLNALEPTPEEDRSVPRYKRYFLCITGAAIFLFVLSVIFMALRFWCSVLCLGCVFAFFLLTWTSFMAFCPEGSNRSFASIIIIVFSLFSLTMNGLNNVVSFVLMALFGILAFICLLCVHGKEHLAILQQYKPSENQRPSDIGGFAVGSMSGLGLGLAIGLSALHSVLPIFDHYYLIMGVVVFCAALFALAATTVFMREFFFTWVRYFNCPCIALGGFCYIFLPEELKIVGLLFLVFVFSFYIIIQMLGTVESVRYHDMPPFYYGGINWICYFLGIIISLAVIATGWHYLGEAGLNGSCGFLIMLSTFLTLLTINGRDYPFNDRVVMISNQTDSVIGAGVRSKAIDIIARDYYLTDREHDILSYLIKGRNARFIADQICISPATVKTHMSRIYVKLNVHSQQELLDLYDSTISTLMP